jgi:hypothetical protein
MRRDINKNLSKDSGSESTAPPHLAITMKGFRFEKLQFARQKMQSDFPHQTTTHLTIRNIK